MDEKSKEFAGMLFDALARKHGIKGDSINKSQLKEFWDQISDQSFDSRLRTFFDMYLFFLFRITFVPEYLHKNYYFIFIYQ